MPCGRPVFPRAITRARITVPHGLSARAAGGPCAFDSSAQPGTTNSAAFNRTLPLTPLFLALHFFIFKTRRLDAAREKETELDGGARSAGRKDGPRTFSLDVGVLRVTLALISPSSPSLGFNLF